MRDEYIALFADSGGPGDELHIVRLRKAPEGENLGRIRGRLPDSFVFRGVFYLRSNFTQTNADGEFECSYYPAPRVRPYQ
jgi:hypothetical protein